MTILLFKTILLLFLLTLGGAGIMVWLVQRLRLNFLLATGFSFVVGAGLYAALVTSLLLKGGFEYSTAAAWLFGAFGLVSCVVALYRKGWALLQQVAPSRAGIALFVLSLTIVAPVAVHAVLYPLTAWDAKMIWMVKAKALYVEPHVPNAMYESDLFTSAHKDYPIGLPALVAAHYQWFGGVSEQPVALTYVAFWWVILALMAGGIERVIAGRTRGSKTNLVVGVGAGLMLLLSAGDALYFAGLGLADIPLASMLLVAASALFFATTDTPAPGKTDRLLWFVLGLIAALIGANTKNEGMSFLVLYVLVGLVSMYLLRRVKKEPSLNDDSREDGSAGMLTKLTAALPILAVATLPLLLWRTIKATEGYRVDLFLPINRTVQYYIDRTVEVAHWFILEIPTVQHWGWALLPMVLVASGAAIWWRRLGRSWIGLATLVLIGGQLLVYVLVYITSPHDLHWHITTSIDRVIMHLVPALYLVTVSLVLLLTSKKQVYSQN